MRPNPLVFLRTNEGFFFHARLEAKPVSHVPVLTSGHVVNMYRKDVKFACQRSLKHSTQLPPFLSSCYAGSYDRNDRTVAFVEALQTE